MKNEEGTVSYDGKLSIQQVIDNLEFLKKREKSSVLIDTMKYAIQLLGRCDQCDGTGEEENITKPNSGYKIKTHPRGYAIYVTPCDYCHGSGKRLVVNCISCGETAAIMPDQRQLSYCHKCEDRLRKQGDLR